jgi:hypothetical protein
MVVDDLSATFRAAKRHVPKVIAAADAQAATAAGMGAKALATSDAGDG